MISRGSVATERPRRFPTQAFFFIRASTWSLRLELRELRALPRPRARHSASSIVDSRSECADVGDAFHGVFDET
jgi:hypothetical protein